MSAGSSRTNLDDLAVEWGRLRKLKPPKFHPVYDRVEYLSHRMLEDIGVDREKIVRDFMARGR